MKRSHLGRTSVALVWIRTLRLYSETLEPSSRLTSNMDGFWRRGKGSVRTHKEPTRSWGSPEENSENRSSQRWLWTGSYGVDVRCSRGRQAKPGDHPCPVFRSPGRTPHDGFQGGLRWAAAALPNPLPLKKEYLHEQNQTCWGQGSANYNPQAKSGSSPGLCNLGWLFHC